jgi:hypothetical protein
LKGAKRINDKKENRINIKIKLKNITAVSYDLLFVTE